MKISKDQNTITLDDGTVLVAADVTDFHHDGTPSCDGCYASASSADVCLRMPCCDTYRIDGVNKIFTKDQKND